MHKTLAQKPKHKNNFGDHRVHDRIILKLENSVKCGLMWSGNMTESVETYCEHDNEPLG